MSTATKPDTRTLWHPACCRRSTTVPTLMRTVSALHPFGTGASALSVISTRTYGVFSSKQSYTVTCTHASRLSTIIGSGDCIIHQSVSRFHPARPNTAPDVQKTSRSSVFHCLYSPTSFSTAHSEYIGASRSESNRKDSACRAVSPGARQSESHVNTDTRSSTCRQGNPTGMCSVRTASDTTRASCETLVTSALCRSYSPGSTACSCSHSRAADSIRAHSFSTIIFSS
eukprot:183760-Rhodomonas_salina.1